MKTHGHGSVAKGISTTYRSWQEMRKRCNNPNVISYKNYGGRGIRICPRWDSYEAFLQDMGERPPGTSLDRKDGEGDYTPENCCWSTRLVQNNNRRNCLFVTHLGRKQTVAQWCTELKLNYARTYSRLFRSCMPPAQAFAAPALRKSL